MAVMATEQPQPVSVDQKMNNDAPEKEKMAVDEPVADVVTDPAKSEDTPATNGQPADKATAANQEAFAANNGLSADSPSKSPQAPTTEDSEMKDANDQAKESAPVDSEMKDVNGSKEPTSAEEPAVKDANVSDEAASTQEPAAKEASASEDPETSSKPAVKEVNGSEESTSTEAPAGKDTTEKPSVQAPASPPQSATPKPATADDAMDVDESVERPEEKASNEQADNALPSTTTSNDKVEPTSPDVAKLDIKSPRQDTQDSQDVPMVDQPTPTGKVSRERSVDEDGEDEPLAKRTKLDSNTAKPAPAPSDKGPADSNAQSAPETNAGKDIQDDQPIKEHHSREMRKELARVKKTKNGMNFRQSVEKLWPGIWESYKAMIDNPVDLAMFEHKFRDNKYSIFGEFKADLQLLNDNALKFNGASNPVSVAAARVSTDLLAKWSEISKMPEPAKAEKGKPQPTRHVESRAATQPRRQSQSQAVGTATSPKPKKIDTTGAPSASATTPVSSAAPAFALPPNGVPQIRRDSTRDDADRPKRPIHPPKNRDPDYGAQNARKKKLEPEMRFYAGVLEDVKKPKYWAQNQWFLDPVDPVALNIPNYFQVIKKPMDLKSMTEKLEDGKYRSGKDVEKDMRQIVANSELFNGPSHVTQCAQELENLFKEKVAEKANWMAKNYPPSAPSVSAPSPEASDAESEDESEAEADENSESVRNVQSRLSEEQVKLNDMLAAKKPDMTMIEVQQNVVSLLQRKLVEEKSKVGGTKKTKAPKKAASKSKSKSGASQSAAGSSNKKSVGSGGSSSKSRPAPKKPQSKKRTIGPLEKQVITDGIGELDGPTLDKAVEIIKRDTHQKEDDDGQLELDIEVLSSDALGKLFELINRAYPSIYTALSKKPEFSKESKRDHSPAQPNNPSKPKKNKPMNKDEQERKIEQLRELKAQFQRQGSGSQEPAPEDEDQHRGGNSSEDSDSEEE